MSFSASSHRPAHTARSIREASHGKKKRRQLPVAVCIGTLTGLTAGLLFLVLFTALGLTIQDPDRITPPLAIVALLACALICGYVSARLHGKSGFLCGILSGLMLLGILILTIFACRCVIRITLFAVCAPAVLVCAAVAGVCAVSGKKERPRKKHRF
ncbi:MAG: TIGR04086 family membrane protein [Clostridia bacterium]|nr:TIGR04086 family membrane protein [Clostridia bacterium]